MTVQGRPYEGPRTIPESRREWEQKRPNGTISRDNAIGSRRPDLPSLQPINILRGGPERRGSWRYIRRYSRVYVVTGLNGLEAGIIDATLWLKVRHRWRQVARWRPGIGVEPLEMA